MNTQSNNSKYTVQVNEDDSINLRDELEKYLIHWKWFLLSGFIAVVLAFVYVRYATPQYSVSSTLLIKDDYSSLGSELAAFQDLGMLGGGSSNIDNEIQILKSRSLAETVVKDLNLNISYYRKKGVKESEIYGAKVDYRLIVLDSLEVYKKLDTVNYFEITESNEIILFDQEKLFPKKIVLNEKFSIGAYAFILKKEEKKEGASASKIKDFRISFKPTRKIVDGLVNGIQVAPIDKQSSVLQLSMKHAVRKKAGDILNTLIVNYNTDAINDKSEVGERTSSFISDRLSKIEEELEIVDKRVESYKKDNKLTNLEEESTLFVEQVSENEKALFETTTQMRLVDFMDEYIQKNGASYELLPANLGFQDASIAILLEQYNEVVLQRNKILYGSSAENPMVKNLEYQLDSYQVSLKESLVNLKASLNITLRELNKQDRKFNDKIKGIPTKEREYRNIQREQGIKEALYLYLLQKQEETDISLAVTTANSKVIDVAYGSDKPVAPRKMIILLAAIIIGMIIPFGIIYIDDLLDNKLHTRKDLEAMLSVPILGDIPLKETKENIVITKDGRSSTAEAFRLLRTNLDFMLTATNKKKGKTIFLTSTVSGEGKSFVSINLACTLALSGKKVALLGMDLRAPKITEYISVYNGKGITNYIMDESLELDDLKINLPKHQGLDIFPSGIIPPNPAELLMHPRVDELFAKVQEEYDYIVVDTAPVNLVTDTLMISDRADLFMYVTRANYLDKRLLAVPQNLYNEKRLPNMAMLINGTDYKKGYGYGNYGAYGYGHIEKGPWWKELFKRKANA